MIVHVFITVPVDVDPVTWSALDMKGQRHMLAEAVSTIGVSVIESAIDGWEEEK